MHMADTGSTPPSLTIIGCGKLGKTLGRLWAARKTFRVQQVLNRSQASARLATDFIGGGEPISSFADLLPADVYMIATPDDQITPVAEQLAALPGLAPGTIV